MSNKFKQVTSYDSSPLEVEIYKKIAKVYCLITTFVNILLVLIHFAFYFDPRIVNFLNNIINANLDVCGRLIIQLQIEGFCFYNLLFLFPVSLYFAWRKKWWGYLGLLSIVLLFYHIYETVDDCQ